MAQTKEDKNAFPKGCTFSGRTIGRMLCKKKNNKAETRGLRIKNQLKPSGRSRFPEGKFRYSDPSGTKTWEESDDVG